MPQNHLTEHLIDAFLHLAPAEAAYEVGYVSASQFSREFKRLFGVPPKSSII